MSGILIIGVLLQHIRKEHDALTRVETANKVIEKELQIAHDIQMGILRGERLEDERLEGERLEVEPNIPLGYDGKYQFVEQGCMLGQGETLVLYTDGVTEARNSAREMLGMKRWAEIIASSDDLPEAIKQYIGAAEPTDDITLMTITKTGAVEPLTIRVENKIDHWPELRTALHNYGLCAGMQPRELKKTQIAIEELVANIVNYSEADWMEMEVRAESREPRADAGVLYISLRDNGGAFDPTRQAEVDTDVTTSERQIGGLGIALVRQIADNLSYRRRDGINELTIIKNINHQ